jgi:signal transduction histidine kinase
MVLPTDTAGVRGDVRRTKRGGSRLGRRIVLSGVALAIVLLALATSNAIRSRRNAVEAARHEIASLSLAMSDQTDRTFQSIDLVLKNLSENIRAAGVATSVELTTEMGTRAAHEMLVNQVVGLSQIDAVAVTAADGHLINFSRPWPIPSISAAERDYFKALRDTPGLVSFISEPRKGDVSGAWTIALARRLNAPDGSFIGLVQAIVKLQYFEDFFRAVGEDSAYGVSLRRRDGTLLARYPRVAHRIGDPRSDADMFAAIREGASMAQSFSASRVDGVSRLRTVRSLIDFPLVVVVSRTDSDITADWRRQSVSVAGGAGLAAAALIIATLLLGRQVARREASDAIGAAALEHMSDGIMMIGGDGRIEVCNRHAMAMLDLTEALIGARPRLDVCDEPQTSEHRSANGAVLEVHSNPLPDGGVVRTYRDVTISRAREAALSAALLRRDAAETDLRRHRDDLERQVASRTQALAASEARLVEAIAAIPEGFVLFDAADRLVLCNAAYRELYGLTEELAKPGTSFADLVRSVAEHGAFAFGTETIDDRLRQRLARHRATGNQLERSEQRLADGRLIEFRERRTADGGIVGLRVDVTAARQREAAEREREKLAALGQLAGGVAHEINNLLQPALTFPELVIERLPAEDVESREDLELVLESVRKARDIVRGILLYARKEEPVLTPLNLAAEGRAALAFVRDLIPPGIALREYGLRGNAQAAVNRTQLAQVLTNLIGNAAHAMHDHGTIAVALGETSPDDCAAAALGVAAGRRYLTLAVTDTGHGMDGVTVKRIFEPFFTTKPIGQGTGLGLPVVYGILKSWGGAIAVESAPGTGTTFTLYIPEIEPSATTQASDTADTPAIA